MVVQQLLGPTSFSASSSIGQLSILSYNVLLPNSVDGWWNYKMYLPPLTDSNVHWSTWEYRKDLLKDRIATVDADVVCFQEVSPISFEDDFEFMQQLGYDGKEMFKKGRFRPATFWKTEKCELAAPPVHKDRTLLTAFRLLHSEEEKERNWYVLNCHLQAGKQAKRRTRQMNEGVRAVMTLAKKLKESNPPRHTRLIVCGDFNGGSECGAVRYLEDGYIDETFVEDGEPVSSGRKDMPLEKPLKDVVAAINRPPPPTLVVPELISLMVKGTVYENPQLSDDMIDRLTRIYNGFASHETASGTKVMNLQDVERWLIIINRKLGRGSEYREAARQMGWKEETARVEDGKPRIELPTHGLLSLEGFINVYQAELRQGKFWGIAYDMAALEEPLPNAGVFQSRYDRMYFSEAVEPTAVMDFLCSEPCPNDKEPSDHLPVAASFTIKS